MPQTDTDRPLGDWIAALAGSSPTPAGGALALVTLAGAAALAAKLARLAGDHDPDRHRERADRFLRAAGDDARGYGPAARRGGAAARAFLGQGLAQAEAAVALLDDLAGLGPRVPAPARPDVTAAAGLAREGARVLVANLRANLDAWAPRLAPAGPLAERVAGLEARLAGPGTG